MQDLHATGDTRRFGPFEVDVRAGELRRQGVRVRLEEQPFQVLVSMLERPGELVSREALRSRLWPAQTYVDFDHRLNVAVARLRAALGDSRENPRYIETLYKRGYRFIAPVGAAVPAPRPTDVASPAPARPSRSPRDAWRLALLGVMLAAAGLAATVLQRPSTPSPAAGGTTPPRRSVAVMSFANLTGRPQQAWLSTALPEWLTTEVAAGGHIRTVPTQSVAHVEVDLSLGARGRTAPEALERIGRSLHTDLVLMGSYAVVGAAPDEKIRVDLRLLDARTGETAAALWELGVESELPALASRAGARLRAALGVPSITREEQRALAETLPSRPAAARLHAEGVARLRHFDALAARELLQKAVAEEPDYALGHAALATAWAELGYDDEARAAAERAFQLSRGHPPAERLLIEGRYYETMRDWQRAGEVYHALFQFYPDNLEYGLARGEAHVLAARWKEVLAAVQELRALPGPANEDPRIDLMESIAARSLGDSPRAVDTGARAVDRARAAGAVLTLAKARLEQAWEFQTRGRFVAADEAAREAEAIYRAAGHRAGAARAASVRAAPLWSRGDYGQARAIYERALAEYDALGHKRGLAGAHSNLGNTLLALGDLPRARRHFEASLAAYDEIRNPGGVTLARMNLGEALILLGELAAARGHLEEALTHAQQMGDRNRAAETTLVLARALAIEGQGDVAREHASTAVSDLREIGSASDAAAGELVLAEILLDDGAYADAEARARRAADELGRAQRQAHERRARVLVARALLQQGRVTEARAALDRALKPRGPETRETALELAVLAARLEAAEAGEAGLARAAQRLREVVREAAGAGFAEAALDARLALAEIEMRSGDPAAEPRLRRLSDEARQRGFQTVSRRASRTAARVHAQH